MCYFITLVVSGSDQATINSIAARHGRRARVIRNPSVARVLAANEDQFLSTVGHCDCGTVLASRSVQDVHSREQDAAKLARKGWSQTKIERWLDDREKAHGRVETRREANASDSIALWCDLVRDLISAPGVAAAGLLLHFYSGDVEDEVFAPKRETVGLQDFADRLRGLGDDVLLMVDRG